MFNIYYYKDYSHNSLELIVFFVKLFIIIFGIGLISTGFWLMPNHKDLENPLPEIFSSIYGFSTGIVRILVGLILVLAIIAPQVLKISVRGYLRAYVHIGPQPRARARVRIASKHPPNGYVDVEALDFIENPHAYCVSGKWIWYEIES